MEPNSNSIRFHKDGTLPQNGEIFVFGSNYPRGIHGAGAAKVALNYGAKMGIGVGLVGRSYAIPTKNIRIETIPLSEVEKYVADFVEFAQANPDKQFFLTAIGTQLAGFSHAEIAPLFAPALPNINYPDCWERYLT